MNQQSDDTILEITDEEELRAIPEFSQAVSEDQSTALSTADEQSRLLGTRIKFWSRAAAIVFFVCLLVGWPLGSSWAAKTITGQWSLVLGYDPTVLMLSLLVPICFLFLGYILSHFAQLALRAEALSVVARTLTEPEREAIDGIQTVGGAVRAEISLLNQNLDDALGKLATAESMIRQQVKAIETAREAIDEEGGSFVERVASERNNLMQLTESMSEEADAFAAAISAQAQSGFSQNKEVSETLAAREAEMQTRLAALESTAEQAFTSLEKLSLALNEQQESFKKQQTFADDSTSEAEAVTSTVNEKISENTEALSKAKQSLEEESTRLEELISEQRERADRLADVIAQQADKLSALNEKYQDAERAAHHHAENVQKAAEATEAAYERHKAAKLSISDIVVESEPAETQEEIAASEKSRPGGIEGFLRDIAGKKQTSATENEPRSIRDTRQGTPWSDILAAADEEKAETLTLHPENEVDAQTAPTDTASASTDVVDRIRKMQRFTLYLIEELYGPPPSATIERFEGGERNIFAHLLLRRNEEDVKLRLQNRAAEDLSFRESATQFLTEFDTLLEPATGATNSETLLDDYLASPLGQVYIIVGSALDYFA